MTQKHALNVPVAAAANSMPQDIAYAVTHNLRAPVINIKGFSEALSSGVEEAIALARKHADELPEEFNEKFNALVKQDLTPCTTYLLDSVSQLENQVDHISSKFSLEHNQRATTSER